MALKSLSTRALRVELARREAGAGKLAAQHRKLTVELTRLQAELAELGVHTAGAAPVAAATSGRKPGRPAKTVQGGGRKRAKNSLSLLGAIMKSVTVGTTVSPAQAAVAAKKTGYTSSSPNFGMMVASALAKTDTFKRIERGQYQRLK